MFDIFPVGTIVDLAEEAIEPVKFKSWKSVFDPVQPCLRALVRSARFSISVSAVIFANTIYIVCERATRNADNEFSLHWLVIEGVFCVLFLLEAVLKISAMKSRYFQDSLNLFDLSLVVLGFIGLILSIVERNLAHQGSTSTGDVSSIIRFAKVLRMLRFLRVFRIFHVKLSADKDVSPELSMHMVKIQTLLSFVGAHIHSQMLLVKYFGGSGKIDKPEERELARCILQSQVSVYQAVSAVSEIESALKNEDLFSGLKFVYERKEITQSLEEFVMSAYADGAISAKEAEELVHPLQHQIQHCLRDMHDAERGLAKAVSSPHMVGKANYKSPSFLAEGTNSSSDESAHTTLCQASAMNEAEKLRQVAQDIEAEELRHVAQDEDLVPGHVPSESSQKLEESILEVS